MAKKVILIILGCLLGLCGIASICFGGIFLGVGGTSGSFKSDYESISTPTVGYVSDPAKIENSQDTTVSGNITLKVDARNSTKPLFFGVGPTSQVQAYLAGSPYQQVTGIDFSPFKITSSVVAGTQQPAAPGDQAFWVAKATGADPALSWKIASGDYEAVLMNADGSPGFQAETRLGIDAPILGKLGIGGLIFGVIVALGGLAILIWGIRTRRAVPATANPYPASYPQGGYPPAYQPPNYGQQGYGPPSGYGQPGTPGGYEQPGGYGQPGTPGGYEQPGGYGQPGTPSGYEQPGGYGQPGTPSGYEQPGGYGQPGGPTGYEPGSDVPPNGETSPGGDLPPNAYPSAPPSTPTSPPPSPPPDDPTAPPKS